MSRLIPKLPPPPPAVTPFDGYRNVLLDVLSDVDARARMVRWLIRFQTGTLILCALSHAYVGLVGSILGFIITLHLYTNVRRWQAKIRARLRERSKIVRENERWLTRTDRDGYGVGSAGTDGGG